MSFCLKKKSYIGRIIIIILMAKHKILVCQSCLFNHLELQNYFLYSVYLFIHSGRGKVGVLRFSNPNSFTRFRQHLNAPLPVASFATAVLAHNEETLVALWFAFFQEVALANHTLIKTEL